MQVQTKLFFLIVAMAILAGIVLVKQPEPTKVAPAAPMPLPDFTGFSDVTEKKDAFFSFVKPIIIKENQRILGLRSKLLELSEAVAKNKKVRLTADQQLWLEQLAENYELEFDGDNWPQLLPTLLRRIDIIPVSLALSQSANESAWGTSRFAVEGNNLFGQWCFSEGCGLIPADRVEGAVHEVRVFASPAASIKSYIKNLNTNPAYKSFRQLREKLRQQNKPLSGLVLADGLLNYSTRKQDYVDELKSMIRVNELSQYDKTSTAETI